MLLKRKGVPAVMSVSMYPGTMTFTRMLDLPTSAARALVNPIHHQTVLLQCVYSTYL